MRRRATLGFCPRGTRQKGRSLGITVLPDDRVRAVMPSPAPQHCGHVWTSTPGHMLVAWPWQAPPHNTHLHWFSKSKTCMPYKEKDCRKL